MKQVFSFWFHDGQQVVTCMLLVVFAAILLKPAGRKKYFAMAVAVLLLCMVSPLQFLAAHYLFSAHMTVHVLLLLCAGPLLLLSLPVHSSRANRFFLFLKNNPLVPWLTAVAVMWCWHIPAIFRFSMAAGHASAFSPLPVLEICSLVLAGFIFSAPILHPNKKYRMNSLAGVVYLFTACIGCSLLGLLITFAPAGIYKHYLSPHDIYGINALIVQQWGITKTADQQAAGLIMWVPCCFLYVTGALYLLTVWFRDKEHASLQFKNI